MGARNAYRHIRPRVLGLNSAYAKALYDVCGICASVLCISYNGIMFNAIPDATAGLRYWESVKYVGHVLPLCGMAVAQLAPFRKAKSA